jgi:hypothetical protein
MIKYTEKMFSDGEVMVRNAILDELKEASQFLATSNVGDKSRDIMQSLILAMIDNVLDCKRAEVEISVEDINESYGVGNSAAVHRVLNQAFEAHSGKTTLPTKNEFHRKGQIKYLSKIYCWNDRKFYYAINRIGKRGSTVSQIDTR